MPPLKPNVANVTIGGKAVNPYTPLSNSSSYLIGGTPKPILKPTTPVAPKLNTNTSIPSTALTKPTTPTDVMTYRSQLQGVQDTATKLQSMLQGTTGPTRNTTIPNADSALLKFSKFEELPQTQTQIEEQNVRKGILDRTKEFFGGKSDRATEAYDKAGVSDARTALTEINLKMAERRKQLRNDLQSLEKDASERGVAREFAIDKKNQINSEAYFELANDALVATALQGNYEMAQADAKMLIDEQYSEYDAYIKQQQAELDYMKPQLTADQKKQADVYQFQLDQMKEQLAQKKDDEVNVKKLAIEIAGQGAPSEVYTSMLNNPDLTYAEAIQIAGPYIGALDRANTYSLINDRANSGSGNGDSGFVELTSEDKKTLIGQGFTQSEINDIPKIVAEFGVQTLLDEYANDPKKLKAITTIYNDPQKEKFLTPEFLGATFGKATIAEKLESMGKSRGDYARFFSSSAAEEKAIEKDFQTYLGTTLVPLIDEYRNAGIADKDILAMMKKK